MSSRASKLVRNWVAVGLATLAGGVAALSGLPGCHPPLDAVGREARAEERRGRQMLRVRTPQTVCDASLVFAREKVLYEQSSTPRYAKRGATLMTRWSRQCIHHVSLFWDQYQGCASPILGNEANTLVYWHQARIDAGREIGMAARTGR